MNMLEFQQKEVFMEKNYEIIKQCLLFEGIDDNEMKTLFKCLNAFSRFYQKNESVFSVGDRILAVGIVLSGSVHVLQEDYWGNRTILAHVMPGDMFGEAFSCAEIEYLPVSVIAAESTEILLIDYKKIIATCSSTCAFHISLIKNMMKLLAEKNIMLTQKMEIITHRTTRERLLSYLSAQAIKAGTNCFTIPFNRQELADYLSVERSAMSTELSHMKNEGVIKTDRSLFELLL